MTPEQQQKYFTLAAQYHRLERLYIGSKLGAGKTFDRVCGVGFTLGGFAAVYVGRDNLGMTILLGALFVLAVILATMIFRRIVVHYMRPVSDQVREGYKLAFDLGLKAGLAGLSEEDCPFSREKVEQARFESRWMMGLRGGRERKSRGL
ncbi:hypothetical protein KUV89_03235 [Marinobacter hydrocarbonoclasticus]|nr:hypothetical protein [Marinobacter nauticus]